MIPPLIVFFNTVDAVDTDKVDTDVVDVLVTAKEDEMVKAGNGGISSK